jgi:predicted nuclease with TOPRIM domain
LGQRVKSDKIDAYVLSTAIHLAKQSDIKVPEYNQTTDEIKELMGYYKFTNKQKTQCINHLESLKAKNSTSYAVKDLEKRVKTLKEKEKKILKEIKDIIENSPKLKQGFENITSRRDRRNSTTTSIYQIPKCKSKRDNLTYRIRPNK